MQKMTLIGNLGADPELKYTVGGVPLCNLRVATDESFTKDGIRVSRTEWHRVVVWNKNAENCAKFLAKGRSVYIEGKNRTRAWEKDGVKHYTTEIVASTVQFLGKNPGVTHEVPTQHNSDETELPI